MNDKVYFEFPGRIVLIGFGSIGQGVLPLILRHIAIRPERISIVTADDRGRKVAEEYGVKFVREALTRENFRRHCAFVNYVAARAYAASEEGEAPLVTGDDLIAELDLPGGRLLGAVLTSVRRAQLEGAVSTKPEALALARSVLETLKAAE